MGTPAVVCMSPFRFNIHANVGVVSLDYWQYVVRLAFLRKWQVSGAASIQFFKELWVTRIPKGVFVWINLLSFFGIASTARTLGN